MLLQKLDARLMQSSYGSLSQQIFPSQTSLPAPFNVAWGSIAPGQTTHGHRHEEAEIFIVAEGEGVVSMEATTLVVKAGDSVHVPPLTRHEFTNTSATQELRLLKIWWATLAPSQGKSASSAVVQRPARTIVTATPPTPNGDLHIGHLSGPYLAADIHTRYLRLRGCDVRYVTGVDDNQSYVALKAERIKSTALATAEQFGQAMMATWQAANIRPDHIGQPRTSPHHVAMVQDMFTQLYERGLLVVKDTPAPYCDGCSEFVFEAYVSGKCPHCGSGSGGNACEVCGRPNDCANLQDAQCNRCAKPVSLRTYRKLYFPLAPHAQWLRDYWSKVEMGPHLSHLCETMLADGLPEIAVSHRSDWGVPVPVPDFEDQRIYVWFEMAAGYLAATQDMLEAAGNTADWTSYWNTEDSQIVQFFGFDNGYFHAVLFPALFHAYDERIKPPLTFVTNEFYRLDGLKFSTSRNHAIWGRELLAVVPVDSARFYLSFSGPETAQTNFTYAELVACVRSELEGAWQSWLKRLGDVLTDEFDSRVPASGMWSSKHVEFHARIQRLAQEAAQSYEATTFSPQSATRALSELVRLADQFASAESHWRGVTTREAERRTGVALQLMAARNLALMAAPIMPEFAAQLLSDLGETADSDQGRWDQLFSLLPAGQKVGDLGRTRFAPVPDALPPRTA